jgi:hypothetical protein
MKVSIVTALLFFVGQIAMAADPTFAPGSPSITQTAEGRNQFTVEGNASPAGDRVVKIRVRAAGATLWQVTGGASIPTGKTIYVGYFVGLDPGKYEVQIVVMTNGNPPTVVSESEVKPIELPR